MALVESDYRKLKRGDEAPNFVLPATDGIEYTLAGFRGAKALLVIFMCNHCPYVKPKIKEMVRIYEDYKDRGLMVIGINPNDASRYPDDSFENMKKAVKEYGIAFPYLRDEEQDVAKAYGATCTPDPFLFNHDMELVFHSRIDSNHGNPTEKKEGEMHKAIGEFLDNQKIVQKEMPSMGCSIKWK